MRNYDINKSLALLVAENLFMTIGGVGILVGIFAHNAVGIKIAIITMVFGVIIKSYDVFVRAIIRSLNIKQPWYNVINVLLFVVDLEIMLVYVLLINSVLPFFG